ncbi:unnamed protein product [Ilex paraguariensis]|uniref:Uncharacterized protein n=1 Tax=Ilex paraguariensis TaxID=185542 RepID=A0ABC8TQH0_9AQUA
MHFLGHVLDLLDAKIVMALEEKDELMVVPLEGLVMAVALALEELVIVVATVLVAVLVMDKDMVRVVDMVEIRVLSKTMMKGIGGRTGMRSDPSKDFSGNTNIGLGFRMRIGFGFRMEANGNRNGGNSGEADSTVDLLHNTEIPSSDPREPSKVSVIAAFASPFKGLDHLQLHGEQLPIKIENKQSTLVVKSNQFSRPCAQKGGRVWLDSSSISEI